MTERESLCECGHQWTRHTSGGMCTGAPPEGSECYCVLFPPDPEPFDPEQCKCTFDAGGVWQCDYCEYRSLRRIERES